MDHRRRAHTAREEEKVGRRRCRKRERKRFGNTKWRGPRKAGFNEVLFISNRVSDVDI